MTNESQQEWLREHSAKKESLDLSSIVAGIPPSQPRVTMADILGSDAGFASGGIVQGDPNGVSAIPHHSEDQARMRLEHNAGFATYPSVPAPVSALFPDKDVLMESSTEGSDLAYTRECFYNPRRGTK